MSLINKCVYISIGKKRFRESYGLYYEDVDVGDIIEHFDLACESEIIS